MPRASVYALLAATLALSVLAFDIGRRTAEPRSTDTATLETHASASVREPDPLSADSRDLSKVAIENIAQVDFRHAYDLMRSASPEVLAQWAARLDHLPASPRTTAAILSFYKTLALLDTKAAVDLVLSSSRRDTRQTAQNAIQAAAPATSLAEVGRMLVALQAGGMAMVELVHEWSGSDPVSASKFVDAHPALVNSNARQLLLFNWAVVDPAAAKDWLQSLDPALRRVDVYEGLYTGWFEHNRQAAVADLVANSADKKMRQAVETTAFRLFKESTDEATAFVLALTDDRARAAAISRIVSRQIVFGGVSDEPVPPERIARWLFSLPEAVAAETIGEAVSAWRTEQPEAVEAWLGDMDVNTHDKVVAKLALAFRWYEPQQNLAAALRIYDAGLRERTLRETLKWIHTMEDAEEKLSAANFSPEQLAELQRLEAEL